ncbi:hypothetical protein JI749_01980 [Devosia oryziradicis]|uniref:Uncharacterized protein n=1 Tax=Devosia oryziradicis TaxID=2801335 RepID=A0ABX7C188_9HYPH|nr:hypothetical protein [Devosia oryziradicis]QQR36430.1 hypothetical protein JI749_01980 [Devosia oryziradicis]
MTRALALAVALTLVSPALAQEDGVTPLLRVYIDAPYFYDIVANVGDASDPRAHALTLTLAGKEVGEMRIVYDCETGDYTEEVVIPWTGRSELFLGSALMAYHELYC